MRLNELLDQYGLQNFDNLSPGSFTDLLDTYCRELNGSVGDAIAVLEEQGELPKAIVLCIRKATSLLLDSNHNLSVCPSFCKLCSLLFVLLSEIPNKRLLSQYSLLLLQSLAKITHSLASNNSFSSLFSAPPSSRRSLCTTDMYLVGLSISSTPLINLISLAMELATITLLSTSNKSDGRVTNYIQLLEFVSMYGPLLSFVGCANLNEVQTEYVQIQMLAIVEKTIPSSILHILTHRASCLKVNTPDIPVSSELKRLLTGIKQYMFSMHALSAYAQGHENKQNIESSESYSEDSDQRLDINNLDYPTGHWLLDTDASLSLDEMSFLKLYASTGLSSLNKSLVLFITSTLRKTSMDSMKEWLGGLYSFTSPSGRQITTLAILLTERLFSRGLKSYAPLSDFLSDLSEMYFMMTDMSISVRIIDIFVEIQASGPVGRTYISTVLYRNLLRNRLSATSLRRKQAIHLLQELFPVSEEVELISLDIDSLISALGDSDTTVREAAMACSIAIISKYYDCMPFAGRSKLLSNLLESTFDISPTIRSLAINGLVELHKVPSLRIDISSFAYNNREKLSLLLLDSTQSDGSNLRASVQHAYIRFICSIAHDAALLSTSETSSNTPQYKVLTTSMRLFYCTIYSQLFNGNLTILNSIFPTPIQTLLDSREENSTSKEGADSSGSEAFLSFLQNIIVSMGYLSGPLVEAVIEYLNNDIDAMKQPETRLLGYAAMLKLLLFLTCYLYEIITVSMKDEEIIRYVTCGYDHECDTGQMETELPESVIEFCNPLSMLLHLITEAYNHVLLEQANISKSDLRTRHRNIAPLISDLTREWCSGCSIKLLTFLKEICYSGMNSRASVHTMVLTFYLKKVVMQLDSELCDNDHTEGSLFKESHSIEFSNTAISFARSIGQTYSLGPTSRYLEFLYHTHGCAPIDTEWLDIIDSSILITEQADYEIDDSLLELPGVTNYKKIIMRYYDKDCDKDLIGDKNALNVVKEAIVSIAQLLVSIHSWNIDKAENDDHKHVKRLILACFCKAQSILCYLYTCWLLNNDDVLPKEFKDMWTACISLILFFCTYLFKIVYCSSLEDADIIISNKSYGILSLLAGIGVDAMIISILISLDISYSPLAVQIIIQLHNYFMKDDAHSSSFTLRAICINNEGALGKIFSTKELEVGTKAIVSLLLKKCISAMLERAEAHGAERQRCMLCIINKLITSTSLEDLSFRDAIFTLMEPDSKKVYYDLLLLAKCLGQ
ncbi:Hypothetical protein GLP15_3267 [Giardia lamblia P15]|uniref:Uncharacterized protein n=1 Tax=Giardia intestinalis (strain P15) TaxID=658858 RepID=E1EWN5_GIAIA|nr:Hypothetical protein GLP15_3267 [Giardia lamblia P15]